MIVDPYYRTLAGLHVLIEKDWLQFGHRFAQRTGTPYPTQSSASPIQTMSHLASSMTASAYGAAAGAAATADDVPSATSSEYSPIFMQFLDALVQLVSQHPQAFEYTQWYLLVLLRESTAARFGNFFGNAQHDRQAYLVPCSTSESEAEIRPRVFVDLWAFLDECVREERRRRRRDLLHQRLFHVLNGTTHDTTADVPHPLRHPPAGLDTLHLTAQQPLTSESYRAVSGRLSVQTHIRMLRLWEEAYFPHHFEHALHGADAATPWESTSVFWEMEGVDDARRTPTPARRTTFTSIQRNLLTPYLLPPHTATSAVTASPMTAAVDAKLLEDLRLSMQERVFKPWLAATRARQQRMDALVLRLLAKRRIRISRMAFQAWRAFRRRPRSGQRGRDWSWVLDAGGSPVCSVPSDLADSSDSGTATDIELPPALPDALSLANDAPSGSHAGGLVTAGVGGVLHLGKCVLDMVGRAALPDPPRRAMPVDVDDGESDRVTYEREVDMVALLDCLGEDTAGPGEEGAFLGA